MKQKRIDMQKWSQLKNNENKQKLDFDHFWKPWLEEYVKLLNRCLVSCNNNNINNKNNNNNINNSNSNMNINNHDNNNNNNNDNIDNNNNNNINNNLDTNINEIITMMNKTNPKYVLRNHLAQAAITRAEDFDDFTEVQFLLKLLTDPYDQKNININNNNTCNRKSNTSNRKSNTSNSNNNNNDNNKYTSPPTGEDIDICVSCSS